ncbi:MAG: hypothetical protein K9M99_10660 [Candidatus Cloacimonetes bacterium]|nr:hypothetical protein [Candidatus Cloacimonadota bacterium]
MHRIISLILLLGAGLIWGDIESEGLYDNQEEITVQPEIEIALLELEESPVAINFEDMQRLLIIPGITSIDIAKLQKIVNGRQISGRAELIKRGMSEPVMQLIDPYITYSKPPEHKFRLAAVTSGTDSSITSSSLRSRLQWGDLEMGFLLKRDGAEAANHVFYPFYFRYDCYPWQLTVGQYALRWGQGLLHAPAFRMGFGKTAGGILHNSGELVRPYTSSYANKYASGAAVRLSQGAFEGTFFFSEAELAVNYADSMQIGSFSDGSDAEEFYAVETCYGGAITGKWEKLRWGLLAEKLRFSADFANGMGWQELENYSSCLEYRMNDLLLNGELARAGEKWGGIFVMSIGSRKFRQYLLFRSYQADFPDIHGNPPARKSHFGGEDGIYYGINLKPAENWQVNMYADLYYFPSARYLIDLPSGGAEQMVSVKYGKSDNYLEVYGRYKNAEQYAAIADSGKVIDVENGQYQITLSQKVEQIILRNRFAWRWEAASEAGKYQRGFVFYQQAGRQIGKCRIWVRLTAFRGELPLYLYENNLRYSSKQVCLTGDGYRVSLLLNHSWLQYKFEFKYYYERNDDGAEQGFFAGISINKK